MHLEAELLSYLRDLSSRISMEESELTLEEIFFFSFSKWLKCLRKYPAPVTYFMYVQVGNLCPNFLEQLNQH